MNNIRQRIESLRAWLRTGDPQMEPEWSHLDMMTMESRGLTEEQYAEQCIDNFDWIMRGE
jgi:hypothetical protein